MLDFSRILADEFFQTMEMPEAHVRMVEYEKDKDPNPFRLYRGDVETMRPYMEALKRAGEITFQPLKSGDRYIYFGTTDPLLKHFIAMMFDVKGYPFPPEYYDDVDPMSQAAQELQETPSKKTTFASEIPWEQLKEIGDHIFLPDADRSRVAVTAHNKSLEFNKVFRTHTIKGGVLIILIDYPGATFRLILDKKK